MDWGRFERALAAEHVESIERRRRLYNEDKAKSDVLTDDEWAVVAEHDEWADAWLEQTNKST